MKYKNMRISYIVVHATRLYNESQRKKPSVYDTYYIIIIIVECDALVASVYL